jgi:hypothetical protein
MDFQQYIASVDPASLTPADRIALLGLLRACYVAGEGEVAPPPYSRRGSA